MHIVIIEDDKILASKIAQKLERNLYTTKVFNDSESFYGISNTLNPDLYLVDINLTTDSGFNVINFIRTVNKEYTPIIIMSGYNDTERKVYGLDIGADDYISKPVVPDELLARIRSILRRHNKFDTISEIIEKDLIFDLKTKKVLMNGEEIRLPKKENQILEFFLQNKGKLISKETLINKIWRIRGDFGKISDNTINATISKLRKKLGNNFELITKVGEGYILEE